MSQIIGFLNKIHGFLSGLNIPDYIFLALFVIIFIWLFITGKKVKRAIGIPFKVIDKQIKKKLEGVDREKAAAKEQVEKEIKKINKLHKKLEAQAEEAIQAMRELRVEMDIQMKQEAGAKEKIQAEKESEEEEIEVEKEAPPEPPAQAVEEPRVEHPPPVKEVQVEIDVEPAKEVEKAGKKEIYVESRPVEELKESVEKLPKKDAASKLTSGQIYILSALGDEPDKTLQEDALFKTYQLAYPDMKEADFDRQIKKLEKLGFIQLERPSGYKVWVKITEVGLGYYRASGEK
jgi:F0F1-type ATP synthase membrane subunit b/b'/DNA-binding MarR family transcriptional regulator